MKQFHNTSFVCASWAESIQPTIMQKMLEASNNPKTISFALGLPDPELFPILHYKDSVNNILHSGSKVLQYTPPISALKQQIIKLMASRNVKCNESQILLTAGGQQGVSLLARLLLNKNSKIITESLTYPGFLQIVTPYNPRIVSIPTHFQKGPCLDSLEKALSAKDKPAFVYLIPDGHNPLGISLNHKQRLSLVELCRLHRVPIIEDDAYGFLNYDEPTFPLRAYEDKWVFYVGTFSKILAPAFRVGWLIVPEELLPQLSFIKEATDINMTTFTQHIVEDFLNRNKLDEHLHKLRQCYKIRRDVMVKTINQYFPENISTSDPKHGFFIWVELPYKLKTLDLFHKALENNIAFMPGQAFNCNPSEQSFTNGMRLNFSNCSPALIENGIERLGKIIKNELNV